MTVSVDDVMKGRTKPCDLVDFIQANHGKAPLVYSSSRPEDVAAAQARYGRDQVSEQLEGLFASVARQLVESGVTRLIVAGGETSGAVAQALDLGDLAIGPEVSPGVPVLVSRRKNLALALKSGNFGGPNFFEEALSALSGGSAMSDESELRRKLVRMGGLLYTRQLAHGSAGNLSVKLDDGCVLVTPTNSSLGFRKRIASPNSRPTEN